MLVTGLGGGGGERATVARSPGLPKLALVYGAYTLAWLVLLADLLLILSARGAHSATAGIAPAEAASQAA
jgi:hypothetical protein